MMLDSNENQYSVKNLRKDLDNLLRYFPSNLPRYTSYPTATQFNTNYDYEEVYNHLLKTPSNSFSYYLHIPFCEQLCYFCACNKIITKNIKELDEYLELLSKELSHYKQTLTTPINIQQIHLGGGSPSYLSNQQLIQLNQILQPFNTPTTEKSIEVDCRTINSEKIHTLFKYNYRRFSLGIQDFDSDVQILVNRIQPYEQVEEVVFHIRSEPKSLINFDLIYGLPGQSSESFTKTIEKVIALSPDRIALYGYANVPWKIKVQNTFKKYILPNPEERLELFHMALSLLKQAGYSYIGLDHFAKPHDELSLALVNKSLRRNFMGYTVQKGDTLHGIGASAISDTGLYIAQKHTTLESYKTLLNCEMLPIEKVIKRSYEDTIRSYCIENLMCNRTLEYNELVNKFSNDSTEKIFSDAASTIKKYIPENLATTCNSKIEITEHGSYFMRFIASVFDAYLPTLKTSNIYSAAV
jgi:oxygen-independent coproporphyrinogen III oxidase